jgi:hypothetical protein
VAARAALPDAAPPARRADRGVLLPAGCRSDRPRRGGARRLARLVREIAFSSGERPVARPFGATDPGRRAEEGAVQRDGQRTASVRAGVPAAAARGEGLPPFAI